jgi:ATP-dependent exoDNAse (exonuclease V) beta subunit
MIIDFKTEPFKQKDVSIIQQKYSLQHKIYLRAATHFFAKQNQQIQLVFYSTADDSTITF